MAKPHINIEFRPAGKKEVRGLELMEIATEELRRVLEIRRRANKTCIGCGAKSDRFGRLPCGH